MVVYQYRGDRRVEWLCINMEEIKEWSGCVSI